MTTYFCDPTQDYQDKSGVDNSGNQYLGVGGLQAAIRGTGLATALVAGDVLYGKTSTGQLGRLTKIVGGKDISGWSLGDEVRDNTAGAHWTGVVCELNVGAVNTTILVELDSAYTRTDVEDNKGDGIENTTAADTTTIVSTACEGIQCDTNAGSDASGYIKVIGVNGSWATGVGTGYCATLDAQSVATNCILLGDGIHGWWWENLILENATGHGFSSGAATNDARWVRVVFQNNGSYGLNAKNVYGNLIHCIFDGNTSMGSYGPFNPLMFACIARNNGGYGLAPRSSSLVVGCVATGNTNANIYGDGSLRAVGCTVDGGVADGIAWGTSTSYVLWSRITNNGEYGIDITALDIASVEDFNVFYNNTSGHRNNISTGPNSQTAADASEAGYTDQPNEDFTLTANAIMAGTDAAQIDLDWTGAPANPGYFTAGLPREYSAGGLLVHPGTGGGARG